MNQLYNATEQDLIYGIGVLTLPDSEPAPFIHIFNREWTRDVLAVVRDSFHAGVHIVIGASADGSRCIHLTTRERIAVQVNNNGHTSVLRAPAWDAQLRHIDARVVDRFVADRTRLGGFLLLIQTPVWEFLSAIDDATHSIRVGDIVPHTMPMPDPPHA
jgi:hypothetical protein